MFPSPKIIITLLGSWLVLSTTIVFFLTVHNPTMHAIVSMGLGVVVFWIVICGGLMYRFRESFRNMVRTIPLPWQLTFFFFATLLMTVEEAVTTTMTNLAPYFGVPLGTVYITASTNFFDVIFFHSVIAFLGPFVCWALVLKRYNFSAFAVFLIFGLSGTIAEALFGGPAQLAQFKFWIFVYGLMLFLPAYTIPRAEVRGAKTPRWYHYILMVFLPLLFSPLFTWIPHLVDPHHPQPAHFPPIQ